MSEKDMKKSPEDREFLDFLKGLIIGFVIGLVSYRIYYGIYVLTIPDDRKDLIIVLSIAIFTLIATCLYTAYNTALYNFYNVNADILNYVTLADKARRRSSQKKAYEKIAKDLLKNSNWWLRLTKINAFLTYCCLVSITIGLIAFFLQLSFWDHFLFIAWMIFLSVFILRYFVLSGDKPKISDQNKISQNLHKYVFDKDIYRFRFFNVPDCKKLKELIDNNPYLKEVEDEAIMC